MKYTNYSISITEALILSKPIIAIEVHTEQPGSNCSRIITNNDEQALPRRHKIMLYHEKADYYRRMAQKQGAAMSIMDSIANVENLLLHGSKNSSILFIPTHSCPTIILAKPHN